MWIIGAVFAFAGALIFIGSLAQAMSKRKTEKTSHQDFLTPLVAAFIFAGFLGFFLITWQVSHSLSAPIPGKDYAITEHGATLYVTLKWYSLGWMLAFIGGAGFMLSLLLSRIFNKKPPDN